MATVKKTIGRLPVYKGDWVAGTYSMLNQVSYLGSTFQSKIDNNTSQPATLVNNVLQVNSNWSVISNGTAAYVANDRLTACETASTYAQAGVDTLRSNVQGVSTSGNGFFKIGSKFCIEMYFKCAPNKSGTNGYYFNITQPAPFIVYSGNQANNSLVVVAYKNDGTFIRPIDNKDANATNEYVHLILAYDGATLQCAYNGVLTSYSIPDLRVNPDYIFNTGDKSLTSIIRSYNKYSLTQDDVDKMYNQGRCDEVVFGDGYKKQYYEFNPIFKNIENALGSEGTAVAITNGFKYSYIKKGTSSQYPRINHQSLANYIPIGSYINIEFDYNVIYGNPILSTIETIGLNAPQDYDKFGQQLTGSGKVKLRSKSISTTQADLLRLCFGNPDQPFEIDVTNVKIYFDSVVNEYTPKYLTKTEWIDSGVNKQDIALTSPTFSYVKPYKDVELSEGAPTTPPVASGCMRIDKTNKRAYLSILK